LEMFKGKGASGSKNAGDKTAGGNK